MKINQGDAILKCTFGRSFSTTIIGLLALFGGVFMSYNLIGLRLLGTDQISLTLGLSLFSLTLLAFGVLALFGTKGFTINNNNNSVKIWRNWILKKTEHAYILSDFNHIELRIWHTSTEHGPVEMGTCTLNNSSSKITLFEIANYNDDPSRISLVIANFTGFASPLDYNVRHVLFKVKKCFECKVELQESDSHKPIKLAKYFNRISMFYDKNKLRLNSFHCKSCVTRINNNIYMVSISLICTIIFLIYIKI